MEAPRPWRNKEAYYKLIGSCCPVCGHLDFPSRAGVPCPTCHWDNSRPVEIQNQFGVGVLLFAEVNGVLNLILFKDICNLVTDRDERKKERIAGPGGDSFSTPKGLNTVTGKVEIEMPPADSFFAAQLVNLLTESMQREIEEEAGLKLSPEKLRFLTESSVKIDQYRGDLNQNGQYIINRFVICAFAALLDEKDLETLQSPDARPFELFDVRQLDKLKRRDVRKATQAILTFSSTALLFIGAQEIDTQEIGTQEVEAQRVKDKEKNLLETTSASQSFQPNENQYVNI